MIRSGQRIFVDAGSTTRIILNYLNEETKAVVVVNHLKVAEQALQFENLSVIMLGGDMIRITNCSSGPVAEEQLKIISWILLLSEQQLLVQMESYMTDIRRKHG